MKKAFVVLFLDIVSWLLIIVGLAFIFVSNHGCARIQVVGNMGPPNVRLIRESETKLPVRQCHLPAVVFTDDSYPEAYEEDLREAIAMWNAALAIDAFSYGGKLPRGLPTKLNLVFRSAIVVVKGVNQMDVRIGGERVRGLTTSGAFKIPDRDYWCSKNVVITMDTSITYDTYRFQSVLRHELGHVLGLGHTNDMRLLMFPSLPAAELDRPRFPQPCEIEAIYQLYGLAKPKIHCGCGAVGVGEGL